MLTRVIRAVSARMVAVRSGVKSQAEAAEGRDVDDDDDDGTRTTFLLLFVLLGWGDFLCSCGVSGEYVPCDEKGDGVNAEMQRGDIITAHSTSTAILDILAVLAVIVGDGDVIQHASAASNGVIRVLFLFLRWKAHVPSNATIFRIVILR